MTCIALTHFLLPRITSRIITIYSNIIYTVFLELIRAEDVLPSIEAPDYLDSSDYGSLFDDPQIRQSIGYLAQAVDSEKPPVVENPVSTPIPTDDHILRRDFHQATTLKGLASLVASSYAARDIYELHKPIFIWKFFTRYLSRAYINHFLMCVYLEGECSYFNPGDSEELSSAMMSWAAGQFFSSKTYVPPEHVVERMLSLFLDMVTLVNRFLTQLYCTGAWDSG
ncbi:hypothetical protein CEP54_004544 [Fusarium duplospermum]|uniref:Uncharacterized protein n=1 Tax=Fusarium duplospermum TaxID=1325734 RepID=A0A428QHH3_9HYPO|nr:hypothetical protein CEP54_004544 [Fusarium duplospermum]